MSSNIVFIDSRVTDYQTLIDNLAQPAEVFILDAGLNGLDQILARLQGRADIDALHTSSRMAARARCIWVTPCWTVAILHPTVPSWPTLGVR